MKDDFSRILKIIFVMMALLAMSSYISAEASELIINESFNNLSIKGEDFFGDKEAYINNNFKAEIKIQNITSSPLELYLTLDEVISSKKDLKDKVITIALEDNEIASSTLGEFLPDRIFLGSFEVSEEKLFKISIEDISIEDGKTLTGTNWYFDVSTIASEEAEATVIRAEKIVPEEKKHSYIFVTLGLVLLASITVAIRKK